MLFGNSFYFIEIKKKIFDTHHRVPLPNHNISLQCPVAHPDLEICRLHYNRYSSNNYFALKFEHGGRSLNLWAERVNQINWTKRVKHHDLFTSKNLTNTTSYFDNFDNIFNSFLCGTLLPIILGATLGFILSGTLYYLWWHYGGGYESSKKRQPLDPARIKAMLENMPTFDEWRRALRKESDREYLAAQQSLKD
jgi:hypothetical protein